MLAVWMVCRLVATKLTGTRTHTYTCDPRWDDTIWGLILRQVQARLNLWERQLTGLLYCTILLDLRISRATKTCSVESFCLCTRQGSRMLWMLAAAAAQPHPIIRTKACTSKDAAVPSATACWIVYAGCCIMLLDTQSCTYSLRRHHELLLDRSNNTEH